ncbi:hypothetical protein BRD17_00210 [Halobacteriales archaeon SW_7_68_16]|nr:MAG: hypothetical protein BRD17_00210 [Halobacteriales archaeon SW_7_68_16]
MLGPRADDAGLCGIAGDALSTGRLDAIHDGYDGALPLVMRRFQDPYTDDFDRVEACNVYHTMPNSRVVPVEIYNIVPRPCRDRAEADHAVDVATWRDREYATLTDAIASDPTLRSRRDRRRGPRRNWACSARTSYRRDYDDRYGAMVERACRVSVEGLDPAWSVL